MPVLRRGVGPAPPIHITAACAGSRAAAMRQRTAAAAFLLLHRQRTKKQAHIAHTRVCAAGKYITQAPAAPPALLHTLSLQRRCRCWLQRHQLARLTRLAPEKPAAAASGIRAPAAVSAPPPPPPLPLLGSAAPCRAARATHGLAAALLACPRSCWALTRASLPRGGAPRTGPARPRGGLPVCACACTGRAEFRPQTPPRGRSHRRRTRPAPGA